MRYLAAMSLLFVLVGCGNASKNEQRAENGVDQDGWNNLLSNDSLKGWHIYGQGAVSSKWKMDGSELVCDPRKTDGTFGDLVTDRSYQDFELELEWKVSKGGNSGILINVEEDSSYAATFATGLEMQLLDNEFAEARHQRDSTHWAGCLYSVDCIAVNSNPLPYGEWNKARVVQNKGKVSFWLNDKLTFERVIDSDDFRGLVNKSPIKAYPDFGKYSSGKIALQNHTDSVAFRNIRIKELI
ncbi:DUF1080 domain-containing protein [Sphingobacterium corticis]|uniref:DUF1080 domain-containing protein n=1 Tax=Sphingobacterium corticis TaxID=1812823 RepID=A0ABW5NHG9_9SPHI